MNFLRKLHGSNENICVIYNCTSNLSFLLVFFGGGEGDGG